MTEEEETAAIGTLLAELAMREPVPAVSYEQVLRGGRRRRVRRRIALSAGAVLAAAAVAAGTVVALPDGGRDSAGPASGTRPAPPPATRTPAPATGDVRDPMTPTASTLLARGTGDNGHRWEVRARLWYAPVSRAQLLQQYVAVWHDEGEPGSRPVMTMVPEIYAFDHVQLSVWVDGRRIGAAGSFLDADRPGMAPQHLRSVPAWVVAEGKLPYDGVMASCAGWTKSHRYPAVVATGYVRPDIARLTVRWSDGTVEYPVLTKVSESPDRFFALSCHPGRTGVISGYDKKGTELLRSPGNLNAW
jgi:hypothetical protein